MTNIDRDKVEMQIKRVLADHLEINMDEIKNTASLGDDLGMDSFSSIEVIYDLEEKFSIEIADTDLANVKTVDDIINYVISRIST
jgi:acyl carrier protein